MIHRVVIGKKVQKQLAKIPRHISDALLAWTLAVGKLGLDEVRRIPGYHDEPLKGDRKGQRSIRLNKAWRAFYIVVGGKAQFVEVLEVNHHEY